MATTYTRSISGDFGGDYTGWIFLDEIQNSSISPSVVTLVSESDEVRTTFSTALSGGELTIFDNLVANG